MQDDLRQSYDRWNAKKQELQTGHGFERLYFREGDIWWCSLGLNIGSESYGKGDAFRRPVLVIKKLSSDLCVVLPLTSRRKIGSWFAPIMVLGEERWAMLYQIRTIHKKRFQHKMACLSGKELAQVKEKLETLLKLSLNHHPASAGIEGIAPKSD